MLLNLLLCGAHYTELKVIGFAWNIVTCEKIFLFNFWTKKQTNKQYHHRKLSRKIFNKTIPITDLSYTVEFENDSLKKDRVEIKLLHSPYSSFSPSLASIVR